MDITVLKISQQAQVQNNLKRLNFHFNGGIFMHKLSKSQILFTLLIGFCSQSMAQENNSYSRPVQIVQVKAQQTSLLKTALDILRESNIAQNFRVYIHNLNAKNQNVKKAQTTQISQETYFGYKNGNVQLLAGETLDKTDLRTNKYHLSSLQHYPQQIQILSELIENQFKQNDSLKKVVLQSIGSGQKIISAETLAIEMISERDRLSQVQKTALVQYFMQNYQRQEKNLSHLIQMTTEAEKQQKLLTRFFRLAKLEEDIHTRPKPKLSIVKLSRGQGLQSVVLAAGLAIIANQLVGQDSVSGIKLKQRRQYRPAQQPVTSQVAR